MPFKIDKTRPTSVALASIGTPRALRASRNVIFIDLPDFQTFPGCCESLLVSKGQDSKTIQNIQTLLFPVSLLSLYSCEGSWKIRLVLLNEHAKEKHHKGSWTAGYSNGMMHPIRVSLFWFCMRFPKDMLRIFDDTERSWPLPASCWMQSCHQNANEAAGNDSSCLAAPPSAEQSEANLKAQNWLSSLKWVQGGTGHFLGCLAVWVPYNLQSKCCEKFAAHSLHRICPLISSR